MEQLFPLVDEGRGCLRPKTDELSEDSDSTKFNISGLRILPLPASFETKVLNAESLAVCVMLAWPA